jgi:hypothetical protein
MQTSNPRPRNSDGSSLTLKKAIDAACDRFEDAWNAGKRPDIKAYLAEIMPAERPRYFRELLLTRLSISPPADPVAARTACLAEFPEHREVVIDVFEELASRNAESTNRLDDSLRDLIRAVQDRLRAVQPKAGPPSDGTMIDSGQETHVSANESGQLGAALWDLLVRHARLSQSPLSQSPQSQSPQARPAGSAQSIAQLEQVVQQFLAVFPELRRQLLTGILLDASIRDVAERHGVTQRTVEMTCKTALGMLGKPIGAPAIIGEMHRGRADRPQQG